MSLVAYDNDSSEYEDDCSDNPVATVSSKNEQSDAKTSSLPAEFEVKPTEDHIFNLLPQPSIKKNIVTEEDDEFLHKKEDPTNIPKPKAKITVPSLSDFKDVNDTVKSNKPRTSNAKKSGLLGILPQPRNSYTTSAKSLIPQVLTIKKQDPVEKKIPLSTTVTSISKTAPKTNLVQDSDDSDDDDVQTDFFSINKPVDIPIVDLPLETDSNMTPAANTLSNTVERPPQRTIESYFKNIDDMLEDRCQNESIGDMATDHKEENQHEQYGSSSNGDVELDEEAILKLCGTRGKRKREDIQIVDVNQDEVLADARQWLLKGLMNDTSKRVSSSKRKGNEPTHQQKRKHQITYLAHQAKANEAELQNQWANNRMSKRQTQSKYGF